MLEMLLIHESRGAQLPLVYTRIFFSSFCFEYGSGSAFIDNFNLNLSMLMLTQHEIYSSCSCACNSLGCLSLNMQQLTFLSLVGCGAPNPPKEGEKVWECHMRASCKSNENIL